MRIAIYARYSSDLQSDNSIEDQLRICRDAAAGIGIVVADFQDAAISGAHLATRPGMQGLLAEAKLGRFDLVLAEALDRISRDQEDVAGIFKRLTFAGVTIRTLAEGEISELHIGLKGTMNAVFLKDMAAKVRRGQRGQVKRGLAPGGLAYGYRVVRKFGEDGMPVTGLREIDPDQALVVRRIFAEFCAGRSAKAIAGDLNRDGILSPRGGHWNVSTINGNKARGNGILHNRLYLGDVIYGRVTHRMDPESGKRRAGLTDPGAWTKNQNLALQIVDETIWEKAQAMRRQTATSRPELARRPKRLLSGLLSCGCCGGPYIVLDKERFGCASNKEGRGCTNTRRINAEKLDRIVLEGLKEKLFDPAALQAFVQQYYEAERATRAAAIAGRAKAERALKDTEMKIQRLVDAIVAGADVPAMRMSLLRLEEERTRLQAASAVDSSETGINIQPGVAKHYHALIEELADVVTKPARPGQEAARREAVALIRTVIDNIELHPTAERAGFSIRLEGDLLRIIGAAQADASSNFVLETGVTVATPRGFEPLFTP